MSCLYTQNIRFLSDTYLFPSLQIALVIFLIFSLLMSFIEAMRAGKGGVSLTVTRSNESMGRFSCFMRQSAVYL